MNNFRNVMRRMRVYTSAVKKNYDSREVESKKREDIKGSTRYDAEMAEVDKRIAAKNVSLKKEVQKDLTESLAEMRKNISQRVTKAPTADMVNSLSILGMLDTVSPTQIKFYAEQMVDCPLAMQRLQQIARNNDIQIMIPDSEAMVRAVDVLESNLANYISGFDGSTDNMAFSVKRLYDLYFRPEETYLGTQVDSAEKVDRAFWENIIGIGSPDMLENAETAGTQSVKVQHFFANLDGLMEYMKKQTEGLEGKAKEDKENEILADCPNQYGANYRAYKATGQKLPYFNGTSDNDPSDEE